MAEPNAGDSATDTGIPADMLDPSEIGKEPEARGDVTGLASRLGWKPKEEWRGPEDKWLDAPDYIGEFEREAPKIKERVRTQKEMLAAQQRELAEIAARTKKQDEMISELLENQRNANHRGFARARAEIEAEMEKAVENADTATFRQRKAELAELDKLRPSILPATKKDDSPPPPASGEPSPAVKEFMRNNAWFGNAPGKDRAMTAYAVTLSTEVHAENPHMSEAEQLVEVRARLEKEFPHKFENPARRAAATVANPGAQAARPSGGKPKAKTEADLPEADRAVMERLVRNKVLTKEQYLKDYQWK